MKHSVIQSLTFSSGDEAYEWHVWVAIVFSLGAVKPIFFNILQIGAGRRSAHSDVISVWEPLAQNVLAGAPLYQVPEATDVKPPGWLYLAIVGEAIGPIEIVLLAVVAFANALAVWLVYRHTHELTGDAIAALAAAAMTMIIVNAMANYANNKTVIASLALAAVITTSPRWSGVAVGVAISIVQFGLLIVPGVAWWWWRTEGEDETRTMLGTACGVFIASFVPLLLWGWRSLINGLLYTFGAAWPYLMQQDLAIVNSTGPKSPITEFWKYYATMNEFSQPLFPMLFFAAIGVGAAGGSTLGIKPGERSWTHFMTILFLVAGLALSLLIRPYEHYWAMVAIPTCVLAGIGVAIIRNPDIY